MFSLSLSQYASCLRVVPNVARAQAAVVIQVENTTCFDYEIMETMDFEVSQPFTRDRFDKELGD